MPTRFHRRKYQYKRSCSVFVLVLFLFLVFCFLPGNLTSFASAAPPKSVESSLIEHVGNLEDKHPRQFTNKNLAVCVVGQLRRLDIESKAKNVVLVNSELGVAVAVFGVLDSGPPRFTNANRAVNNSIDECYDARVDDKFVLDKASWELQRAGARYVNITLSRPANFSLTPEIQHWARQYRDPLERSDRLQNHLRVYKHDADCVDMIERYENESNIRFDAVFRVRENAIVHQPLTLTGVQSTFYSCLHSAGCVVSKSCSSWGGYSDKFWVIPRTLLEPALRRGINDMLKAADFLKRVAPVNSERLLKSIWDHHGVRREVASPDQLPVTDARCILAGDAMRDNPSFRLVDPNKDCSASKSWNYQRRPLLPTKIQYSVSRKILNGTFLSDGTPEIYDHQESSYGFYYPSPFSFDGKFYAAVIRNKTKAPPNLGEEVTVAIYSTDRQQLVRHIGRTSAYNIPFGPRVQFVGKSYSVIFNDRITTQNGISKFQSRVVDINSGSTLYKIRFPIFSLDAHGTRATSLDFARLSVFTAEGTYGYAVSDAQSRSYLEGEKIPDSDGIWAFDPSLKNSTRRLVVSPRMVVDHLVFNKFEIYSGRQLADTWLYHCFVWLEQPRLNDEGSRIIFMARAKCPSSPVQDDLQALQRLPYLNIGAFTIGWNGDNLWYAARAPTSHFDFVGTGPGELLFCGNEGMWLTQDQVGGGSLLVSTDLLHLAQDTTDRYAGHCSLSREQPHLIVTDTSCTACLAPCPESSTTCIEGEPGRQLGMLDLHTKTLTIFAWLGTNVLIPEPLFVDLHPRFSPGDKYLAIDSAHDEVRGSRLYLIALDDVRNSGAKGWGKPHHFSEKS